MKTSAELLERILFLQEALYPEDRDEKDAPEDDVIDRSGYDQDIYADISAYTESLYENMDQITYGLQRGKNQDGTLFDYRDALVRMSTSLFSYHEKFIIDHERAPDFSPDDTTDLCMNAFDLVRQFDVENFGHINTDQYEMMCQIIPSMTKIALDYPENFQTNDLVAQFYDMNTFCKMAASYTDENGLYISKNADHVFYFNPQYPDDMRCCGCAVKSTVQDNIGVTKTVPYYYMPYWHGEERAVTVEFVWDAIEARAVRSPNGRHTKYIETPDYEEKRAWLFSFYDNVRTVFGCDPTHNDLYQATQPSKTVQILSQTRPR